MKLEFIPLGSLFVDKANMRYSRSAPDVSDLLPSVRKRGIVQTLLVKPANDEGMFGIVAGARRFHAARLAEAEARGDGESGEPAGRLRLSQCVKGLRVSRCRRSPCPCGRSCRGQCSCRRRPCPSCTPCSRPGHRLHRTGAQQRRLCSSR